MATMRVPNRSPALCTCSTWKVRKEGLAGGLLDAVQQDEHRRREVQLRGPRARSHSKFLVPVVRLQLQRRRDKASTQQAARER